MKKIKQKVNEKIHITCNWRMMLLMFVIGVIFGVFALVSTSIMAGDVMLERYPIVGCIFTLDEAFYTNTLMFTENSTIDVIQWRCAKQYVDFNITNYSDLFIINNQSMELFNNASKY